MALQGEPFDTARTTLAQFVAQSATLTGLGLEKVYQADTAESPKEDIFAVIRWGDEVNQIGESWERPVDFWFYGPFGDYNKVSVLAQTLQTLGGKEFLPIPTATGWLSQFNTKGVNLGIGGDLADEGFDKLVIPLRTRVIGRGV